MITRVNALWLKFDGAFPTGQNGVPALAAASRGTSAQVRLRLVCFITAVCGGMRHWLPNDCALEGRAGDTVLSLPFHPRLCKLHLLKRKVFQYVVSFKGGERKKEAGVGVGDGALFVLAAPAPIGRLGTS